MAGLGIGDGKDQFTCLTPHLIGVRDIRQLLVDATHDKQRSARRGQNKDERNDDRDPPARIVDTRSLEPEIGARLSQSKAPAPSDLGICPATRRDQCVSGTIWLANG